MPPFLPVTQFESLLPRKGSDTLPLKSKGARCLPMVLDTAFAIIAGFAQLITAWIGYRVSARPIPIENKRRHRIYESIFVIAGVLGAATVVYNGISLSKALSDIVGSQKTIEGGITQVIRNTNQP